MNWCSLENTSIFYAVTPNVPRANHDGVLVTCSGADRNNLTFSTNLKEPLGDVDLVQENGLELVDLKLLKDIPNAVVPASGTDLGLRYGEHSYLLPVPVEFLVVEQ